MFSPLTFGQIIWGVGSVQGVSHAEFSNSFVNTGSFVAGDNPNDWTALSINDSGGNITPGSAYWIKSLFGYSQGAYNGTNLPILSPSQTNGVAIFDSDYMDNNGVAGNFGTGTSPSSHRGELISPRIDLSGYTDSLLEVKFYSKYRGSAISSLSLAISVDDGLTWGTEIDYRYLQANLLEGFIVVPLQSSTTQGVVDLTQCRLKINFDGDYYYAIIDDVSVRVKCTADTVNDVISSCTPITWIDGNTYSTSNDSATYTLSNSFGCDSIINLDLTILDTAITLDLSSLPTINDACSIILSAPTATDFISGSILGVADVTFPINTIGTTTITWTYTGFCGNTSIQTQDVEITGVETGTWIANDGISIVSSNINIGVTYQWIDCSDNYNPLLGKTNHIFTPTYSSDFAVIITENGCSDTSNCVTVTEVGIENLSKGYLNIYPNPTINGLVTVSSNNSIQSIEIVDMLGRKMSLPIDLEAGFIDGSELSSGKYIIKIQSEDTLILKEIVVLK